MVAINFNPQQYQPQYSGGGGLSPGDKIKVILCDAKAKPVRNKPDNGMLELTLKCIEGPQAGRTQTDNLNLWNTNPQTVEIANKQLSAYCHAVGKFATTVADTTELFNIPFCVDVRQQKDNDKYTEISAVYDINGNAPGATGPAPVAAPQAPPPAAPPAQPAQPGQWAQAPAAAPAAPGAPAAPTGWQQPAAAPAPAPAPAWGQPAAGPAPAPSWVQPAAAPAPAPSWVQPAAGPAPAAPQWGR